MTLSHLPAFPGLAFPITRANKGFGVIKQDSISGARTRIPTRNIPQYVWTISFNFLRAAGFAPIPSGPIGGGAPFSDTSTFSDTSVFSQDSTITGIPLNEVQQLGGFYNSLFGGTLPFLYTEPSDCAVTNELFGVADGVTMTYQLVRKLGGFAEPVYAPASNVQILVNGVVQPAGAYTISPTGVVSFTTPPMMGLYLTWTGAYAWICRFDDESIDFENFMSGLWQLKKLTFSSDILA